MSPTISVVICTHNARPEYLDRTLTALRLQTLPLENWELILVDNASDLPVSDSVDLRWHPQGLHLHVATIGKTHALLAAWQRSRGELMVIVDDDNILAPDYLETACTISRAWPLLGAWSGQGIGEFEIPPPDWLRPYWHYLAVREFKQDIWARLPGIHAATPYGAGMCARRPVIESHITRLNARPHLREFGRKGTGRLHACEDLDLAMTAYDCGFGTGLFSALRFTHLIPAFRLELAYVIELIHGAEYSGVMLKHLRGQAAMRETPFNRCVFWLKTTRMKPIERCLTRAAQQGRLQALKEIARCR